MSDLVKSKRARAAARAWLSRVINTIEAVLESEQEDDYLDSLQTQLSSKMETLKEAQQAVEIELETEEDLNADIAEAAEIEERAEKIRLKLLKARGRKDASGDATSSTTAAVQLPKLDLPKFSGEIIQWQPFWDTFTANIDNQDLPEVSKFAYLNCCLIGEAKRVVSGLSLTSQNYRHACELLKQRFGKRERIVFAHVQGLLNLTLQVHGDEVSGLRELQDKLLSHVRSLQSLDITGDSYSVFLTPLILSKLPEEMRLQWSRTSNDSKETDVEGLLSFLDAEISRRELARAFSELKPSAPRQKSSSGAERGQGRRQQYQQPRRREGPPTAAALHSTATGADGARRSAPTRSGCGFCHGAHPTEACSSVLGLPVTERKQRIQTGGLCFRCLEPGHLAKTCMARCSHCKGKHNVICCYQLYNDNLPGVRVQASDDVRNESSQGATNDPVSLSCVMQPSSRCIVLPTAKVTVQGHRGSVTATLLFDSGSDRSYVSSSLVRKVAPELLGLQRVRYAAFGGGQSGEGEREVFQLQVSGANLSDPSTHRIAAVEVPVICAPLSRPSVSAETLQQFKGLELADQHSVDEKLSIDILVGLDSFWRLMETGSVRGSDDLVAMKSAFGWVLSGGVNTPPGAGTDTVGSQLLSLGDLHESTIRSFWDLESIGIVPEKESVDSDPVLKQFEETVQFNEDSGRYKVSLPWKSDSEEMQLQNNKDLAQVRLKSLSRKLDKDPDLKSKYSEALKEMEDNGVIGELDESDAGFPGPVYYLPHFPVVKEERESTKTRPVFDASAPGPNGMSLNDCLHTGPSLNPNLMDVLMRFRRHQVAVVADISKAFLNIELQQSDQQVQRFLWEENGAMREMKIKRVTFGVKSSPFLLNATLRHHLSLFPDSQVVSELKSNMYVDDWVSGADTEQEAWNMFIEAREILEKAGMPLSKCASNNRIVFDKARAESVSVASADSVKVLGVRWLCSEDCFSFDGVTLPDQIVVTKRVILSFIARFFDPLGFLSPFLMLAKVIFQDLWKLGLGWDDPVPAQYEREFQSWIQDLDTLKSVRIHRRFSAAAWSESLDKVELHVFGDASEKGYGAMVYLKIPKEEGSATTSLVAAKARVAPLKRVTIPRLELLAALLAARLLSHVKSALGLPDSCSYTCWSDSQVALAWLRGDPSRWKQFVSNRVTEIQRLTDPQHWAYCHTSDNPADMLSRGATAEKLVRCQMWFHGPAWLAETSDPAVEPDSALTPADANYLQQETSSRADGVSVEELPAGACYDSEESPTLLTAGKVADSEHNEGLPFYRWGSFLKVIRIVGWIRRFIHNARSRAEDRRKEEDLSFLEISQAKHAVLQSSQKSYFPEDYKRLQKGEAVQKSSALHKLDPMMGSDGLIRVKGRLQQSDLEYAEKHPVILPKCHLTKLLVRFQHEKVKKHAGVSTLVTSLRDTYWILGVRRLAKEVKKSCVSCQRHDAMSFCQPAAPLPGARVTQAPPFSVCGIDFAGPVYCSDLPGQKLYICLFVCAVTRALHVELTISLSVCEFMLAFRRFAARRSLPRVIYSDNAATFKAADKQLRAYFGHLTPEWRFIAPRAPWWGGWYERMVRSIKSGLKKSLGSRSLTRTELETILYEIESTVNSRPLTFVSDDVESDRPLTPNDFLLGTTAGAGFQARVIEDPECISPSILRDREKLCQKRLDRFWSVWSSDYLRSLPVSVSKFSQKGEPRKSSVVLIHDNTPRMQWKMGVIEKLYPGRDGKVRTADVRTSKGVLTRPIQRLHDLEITGEPIVQ